MDPYEELNNYIEKLKKETEEIINEKIDNRDKAVGDEVSVWDTSYIQIDKENTAVDLTDEEIIDIIVSNDSMVLEDNANKELTDPFLHEHYKTLGVIDKEWLIENFNKKFRVFDLKLKVKDQPIFFYILARSIRRLDESPI